MHFQFTTVPSLHFLHLRLRSEVRNGSYVWREGTQIDGASDNPPADTLLPLYDPANQDVGSVMWSDEPGVTHCPQGCSSPVLGHSKGEIFPSYTCLSPQYSHSALRLQWFLCEQIYAPRIFGMFWQPVVEDTWRRGAIGEEGGVCISAHHKTHNCDGGIRRKHMT